MNTFRLQRSCLRKRLRTLHECEVVIIKDIDKTNSSYLTAKKHGLRVTATIRREGEDLHKMYDNLMKQIEEIVFELKLLELEMMDLDLGDFVVLDKSQGEGSDAREDREIYRVESPAV